MEVAINQAVLHIEGRRKVLNKALAKQFPFVSLQPNYEQAIAKVRSANLGRNYGVWCLLEPDRMYGLRWVEIFHARAEQDREELLDIPTIYL